MRDPRPGDDILILDGILAGYHAKAQHFDKERGTLTAYIKGSDLKDHPRTFTTNKKGYVPFVLLEGEYEIYGERLTIVQDQSREGQKSE